MIYDPYENEIITQSLYSIFLKISKKRVGEERGYGSIFTSNIAGF